MKTLSLYLHKRVRDHIVSLEEILVNAKTKKELYKSIVNAPFTDKLLTTQWSLGIVVLLLVNEKTQTIDRIALSNTDLAKGAVQMSSKRFEDIKIPLHHDENIIAQAIDTGKRQETHDWKYLFVPDLTPEQARFNQAGAGIDASVVYPLKGYEPGGALIFSHFNLLQKLSGEQREFMKKYTQLVSDILSKHKN